LVNNAKLEVFVEELLIKGHDERRGFQCGHRVELAGSDFVIAQLLNNSL